MFSPGKPSPKLSPWSLEVILVVSCRGDPLRRCNLESNKNTTLHKTPGVILGGGAGAAPPESEGRLLRVLVRACLIRCGPARTFHPQSWAESARSESTVPRRSALHRPILARPAAGWPCVSSRACFSGEGFRFHRFSRVTHGSGFLLAGESLRGTDGSDCERLAIGRLPAEPVLVVLVFSVG